MTKSTGKQSSFSTGNFVQASFLIVLSLFALFALLAATGCNNPLVGLGARVDLTPPTGTLNGISNGDYVSGDITLTGTAEDDTEVEAVWANIEGQIVSGVVDPDGTWNIDVDTADVLFGPDGEKDITINLRDASGKVTEKQMLLFFDNTAPVLMVTSPDLSSPQDTSPIVIRGEAYDPLRLKEVRATGGQGTFVLGANSGTADSWLFNLNHSLTGTETLGVILEAEDLAGNVSTTVFHAKDLRYLNNEISITVIDLYNLVDDQTLFGAVITPADVDEFTVHAPLPSGGTSTWLTYGAGLDGLPIEVDMSGDVPQITVTTPNPNITAPGDTMGPASKVNGSVSDNVEVDETSVEIRFLEGDGVTESITWAAVTILPAQIINDQNINFSYSLPGVLVDANYYVQVKALDNNGTEGLTALIPFRLDGNAPVIEITAPALSAYIPDTSTLVEGTAFDSEPILVEISLNGTNWETVDTLVNPGGAWSYQISDWETAYPSAPFSDFDTIPISARATANGTTTYTNHSLILDRVAPTVEFITPPDSRDELNVITGDVNGVVTLRVAVSDDSLYTVSHKIGINGPVEAIDSGSLYNWSEIVVTPLMQDPNLATEISPGIWELPVTVTAVDKAGNTTVTSDYTMIIDNAQDRPNVSVIYPIEGQSYGGEVVVSGIATDDDGAVGAVWVQVDLDTLPAGTPDFASSHTFTVGNGIDFDGTGEVLAVDEFEPPYQVSGLSSWSFPLNTTGALYDLGGGHNGDIYVKVWAEDPINPTVTSVPQVLHFRFDDTLPRIDQVLVDGIPAAGNAYVSGSVDMEVTVSDDTLINKLEVSYDNGVSWENTGITPAQSVVETISINTATKVAGGNGILYLRLKATDNTGYTTLEVLPLNVDNNAPLGTFTGAAPSILDGNVTLLQGTASDPTGSISGIDRIEVYLERLGLLYNPKTLLPYPYTNPATPDIATEQTSFGAGNYYPANPTGLGVMIIDDIDELGQDSVVGIGDQDGYKESLTLSASTWNWWVKFNSEKIPDGDITIHYVVVDKAGNKTHYSQSARIENTPPIIESFLLGTDVNYNAIVDQTVGNGETFQFTDAPNPLYPATEPDYPFLWDRPVAVTGITTRNNRLFIDANASATDGNGLPSLWLWELYYDTDTTNRLGVNIDTTTITDFDAPVSMPDANGIPFILRVTDDAGLTDEIAISLNLDNTDTTLPDVTLYDLNLNHSSILDARDGVADLDGYAVPGYLPSDEPLWGNAQGRLHPQGVIVYDGDDADVSGTIIVSGLVEDDKAIHQLSLTITGYNGGLGSGNPFPILDWDPAANSGLGGLKTAAGVIGTAHISSESYGESTGHAASWSFEFDTATITGGAAANIRVKAIAKDKSNNDNLPVDDVTVDNYTIDVMPFIADVTISNAAYTANMDILRSKYGTWPIREDSYLIIDGFNLGTAAGTLPSLVGDPTQPDLAGALSGFTGTTVSGDRKQVLTQAAGIVNSGWLAMTTNTIELMNYYGDFDENDSTDNTWSSDAQWTDNRYLQVWDVADVMAGSADAVWGAMDVDPTDGSLWGSWSEYSAARVYVSNENTPYNDSVGDAGIFRIYDPSEYTDIAMNDSGTPYVVHLANFFGGGGDWDNGAGGLVLWGNNADTWPWAGTWAPYGNTVNGVKLEEVERFFEDQRLWQFLNPRITAAGADGATDIHISYYDNYSKALKYAHFRDQGGNIYNITFETVLNGTADSGTDNKEYLRDNMGNSDQNILAGDAWAPGDAGDDGSDAGLYSDIAVDLAGRPVIVYYDTTNATLRLTRANTNNPISHVSGTDWVDQPILADFSYVGKYPSVRIDPDGRIHVTAYKISTGDLMYYSAPDPGAGIAYAFDTFQSVDLDGNMGAYADMDLFHDPVDGTYGNGNDVYRPVIGYLNASNVGTFQGLKYAFRRDDGFWEHGTVPLLNTIEDERISAIGKPINLGGSNYSMAIGFHSSSYRYVWLRPE